VNTQAFGRDEGKNCDLRVYDPIRRVAEDAPSAISQA
jgi:hypothetical protein